MAYQSLYRRYRPRRFAELRGQAPIATALRNAVRDGRVAHAYLFSGPRGTGKTSTARILAKALNCEQPVDGEPCLECASCAAIEAGTSFDVHELDAASNNGVDAMRDLIQSTALASPGRTKVYILDEVHMLSAGAENAFLKTLEEPPPGVIFVLATTDPQKVRPTIRSRTQHFDFHLLPAAELEDHVRWIVQDAGLDVDDAGIEHALRVGGGSARDTLSALDQVVAAGGVAEHEVGVDDLVAALTERDPGKALVAVADAVGAGRDPRVLGEALAGRLRDVFLCAMKAPLDHLPDADRERVQALTEQLDRPYVTRCIEGLGDALAKMPESADRRILLEATLVRLADVSSDTSVAALLERIERLERALHAGGAVPSPPPPTAAGSGPPSSVAPLVAPRPDEPTTTGGDPAAAARARLAEARSSRTAPARPAPSAPAAEAPRRAPARSSPPAPQPVPAVEAQAPSSAGAGVPDRDALTMAWGDEVLELIPRMARARYASGRFVAIDGDLATFALPNQVHVAKCEEMRVEVEGVLSAHFGVPLRLSLVVDDGSTAAAPAPTSRPSAPAPAAEPFDEIADVDDIADIGDVAELDDAPADDRTGIDRLAEAFPGAQLFEEEGQ